MVSAAANRGNSCDLVNLLLRSKRLLLGWVVHFLLVKVLNEEASVLGIHVLKDRVQVVEPASVRHLTFLTHHGLVVNFAIVITTSVRLRISDGSASNVVAQLALRLRHQTFQLDLVNSELLDDFVHIEVALGKLARSLVLPHVFLVLAGTGAAAFAQYGDRRYPNVLAVHELFDHVALQGLHLGLVVNSTVLQTLLGNSQFIGQIPGRITRPKVEQG